MYKRELGLSKSMIKRLFSQNVFLMAGFSTTLVCYLAFAEKYEGEFDCEGIAIPVNNAAMLMGGLTLTILLFFNLLLIDYLRCTPQFSYFVLSVTTLVNLFISLAAIGEILNYFTFENILLWFLAASRGEINLGIREWYSEIALAKCNGVFALIGFIIGWTIVIVRTTGNKMLTPRPLHIFQRDV